MRTRSLRSPAAAFESVPTGWTPDVEQQVPPSCRYLNYFFTNLDYEQMESFVKVICRCLRCDVGR